MSSANLEAFLKKEEGWKNKAYPDSGGVWTIGYGRTTNDDGTPVMAGQTTTVEAENSWLAKRAKEDYDATKAYLDSKGYDYTPGQLDALSSFRYNGGQGMLEQLTDGGTRDWDTIKVKMPQYNKVDQGGEMVAVKGLTNRRNAELGLWGEYSNSSPELNVPVLSPSNLTNNTSLRPPTRPAVPAVDATGITNLVELSQPVPQVQTQQLAINGAVVEALQNPTGFPTSNMPDIPLGYNQGTSGIPMPEEGLAQQHLYEEYLRKMNEIQQPIPVPSPVTTTTLPPAQYNSGTSNVGWFEGLKNMLGMGITTEPTQLNYGVPKPGQGYGVENFGEGNIFTNGLQQQTESIPPVVTQVSDPRFNNVPTPGFVLDDTPRGSESYTPPPIVGRNLDVAMGDDGKQRISAKYLDLPLVSEAMELNRVNDGGGTYFRDGDKVKYVATGAGPESEVPKINDSTPMTQEEAMGVFQNPDATELERLEARRAFGGEVYSGSGEVGMSTPPSNITVPPTKENLEAESIDSSIADLTGINPSDPVALEAAAENAVKTSELGVDSLKSISSKLLDIFGLEANDVSRAVGFYLLSRATGASHAGSMRWAGGTVLKQAEARTQMRSKKADAASKAFASVSGNYTKEAGAKITKLLLEDKLVEAQALMNDPASRTARGKLGIDANATGDFYIVPGYTKAMEIFEGSGGNRYTKTTVTENGKTVEKYVPISSEQMGSLRERNQDDDITSYLAAVRAHVNTLPEDLFKPEFVQDGKVVREKGIFSGRSKGGVTEDIMRLSLEQGKKGLPDDPREIMMMVSKAAALAKSAGVKDINAETLFEMQIVGGDTLFDQGKISKDGELVASSKIKSFTTDFQDILSNDREDISAAINSAASNWNPEMTMETVKDSTNYVGLTPAQKAKVDSAPSSFMALSLTIAYQYKNKNET